MMDIKFYSDNNMKQLKELVDKELDTIQDRLQHFKSSVIKDLNLKNCYRLNVMKDGFEVDTAIDSAIQYIISQTIRYCKLYYEVRIKKDSSS